MGWGWGLGLGAGAGGWGLGLGSGSGSGSGSTVSFQFYILKEICTDSGKNFSEFRRINPNILEILKSLYISKFSEEL